MIRINRNFSSRRSSRLDLLRLMHLVVLMAHLRLMRLMDRGIREDLLIGRYPYRMVRRAG